MKLNCSFIVPYKNEGQVKRLESQLRKDFEDIEIIPVFNAESFFDAWREGIKKAEKKYIIFTHEDTIFHSFPDLDEIFKDESIGMVGIAGSRQLDKANPWWFSAERFRKGLLSGRIFHENNGIRELSVFGPFGEVVVLDGVCLVTTKEKIEKIGGVPAKDYGKWDFYDHIISMEFTRKEMKLLTVPIDVTHFSAGENKRKEFFEDMKRFAEEYLNGELRV